MNTFTKYSIAALIAAMPVTGYAQMDASPRNNDTQRTRQVDGQRDVRTNDRTNDRTTDAQHKKDAHHKVGKRVSKYIGKAVYNHENQKIGDIQDLVMDGGYNRISYAVLSFGGFLGMGNKYFAIPWSSLEYRQGQDDRLFLNVTEQSLRNAPGFDKDAWPDAADATFRTQVDTHYGVTRDASGNITTRRDSNTQTDQSSNPADRSADRHRFNVPPENDQRRTTTNQDQQRANADGAARTNQPADADAAERRRATGAGDDVSRTMSGPTKDGLLWARRVSQVIDADIKDASNQDVGEIEDLIVEPATGRIAYAVIDLNRAMRSGERYAAIPISKLSTDAQDKEFILSMGRDELRNAPSFNSSQWPDWSDDQFRNRVDRLSDARLSDEVNR